MKKHLALAIIICITLTTAFISLSCKKKEVILVNIEVNTQPTKMTYTVNDEFDLSGMIVTATYSDGSTKPVTITDAMLTYDFSKTGTNLSVTITYEGKTTAVTGIIVNEPPTVEVTLLFIRITEQPTKEKYLVGDEFDPTGMEVTALYSDFSTVLIDFVDLDIQYNFSTVGYTPVTISYKSKNTSAYAVVVHFFGDGKSLATAYQIGTPAQLAKLAELVNMGTAPSSYWNRNVYYKLTADIDLSAYGKDWNYGKGWIPIGTVYENFYGHFDGNYHKVSGLYINNNQIYNAGLFGCINDGSVQNLYVYGEIAGYSDIGGVAGSVSPGFFDNCSISNCYSAVSVTGNDNVGCVVGRLLYRGSSITNCYATGDVNGNRYVGGIAGRVVLMAVKA